jgi:hypothetical protein
MLFRLGSAAALLGLFMKKHSRLLVPLLLVSGCTHLDPSTSGEGAVKLGQVAHVAGARVRPDRLIEDSRCPSDAQCVWAGRVIVRAYVSSGGSTKQLDLTLGMPVKVADGTLELVSVSPERREGEKLAPTQLRFIFDFNRKSEKK